MSKMDGLGVLSTRTELGAEAFRPFDRDRSGSVFGEGAALLVLEDREHALARGAHVYAEVTGFGSGNDCVRPPSPQARARGLARAIGRALTDSGNGFADGGYIAAHGCATRQGDASETLALHDALGTSAKAALISSVKPQTGHLVGGAGALNAAVAALTLDSGVVAGHAEPPQPRGRLRPRLRTPDTTRDPPRQRPGTRPRPGGPGGGHSDGAVLMDATHNPKGVAT